METDASAVRRSWLGILLRSATLRERMAAVRVTDPAAATEWPREQFQRWEQLLGGEAESSDFPRLHERLAWEKLTPDDAARALKTLPPPARDHLLRALMARPWAKLLRRAMPELTREKLGDAAWEELRARTTDAEWELAQSLRGDLETDLQQRLDWWVEGLTGPPQFSDHAALARALAIEGTHWARSWKLFAMRWLYNICDLQFELKQVTVGNSDPHKGGQRVIFCQHAGWRSVYKPRDVSHEDNFVYFTSLSLFEFPIEMGTYHVKSHPGYGWMDMVSSDESYLTGQKDLSLYSRQCGALLCLAHILGATDLHHENVIHSDKPYLIDLESLFFRYTGSVATKTGPGATALETAAGLADGSVWQTGLLPQWWRPQARVYWDISGLFGGPSSEVSVPMESRALTGELMFAKCAEPSLDYAADIIEGFQRTYQWLLDHRKDLQVEDSPWWDFNPSKTRYFHRPTREYERLRERLREPGLLRDGVTRSFALERLFRLPFDSAGEPESESVGGRPSRPGDPQVSNRGQTSRSAEIERVSTSNVSATGKSPVSGVSGAGAAGRDGRPPGGEGQVDAISKYRRALGRMSTMEVLALERGDVPSFRIQDLEHLGLGELPPEISPIAAFAEGREPFLRRILEEHLSEADLRRQIDDIRTALASAIDELQLYRHLANLPAESIMSTEAVAPDPLAKARENASLFGKAAESLGERLVSRAVRGEDGSVLWVDGAGLKPSPSGHPLEAYYLYLGRLGPILFLAAAGHELKRVDFVETAQGALDPLLAGILEQDWARQASSYEAEVTPPRLDPGFGTGIGGLVYGLAVLSRWLPARAERLEAAARELLPLLAPELSHPWACADIESGLAGGLMGLLAAHQTWGLPGAVPYARQFAKSLDRRAVEGEHGGRAWYFPDAESGEMMAGFGHGASGIAAALCRLAETQGMAADTVEAETWLKLASEAWRYEATVFDAEAVNWPVVGVQRSTGALFLNAWCNGAPGIGYSRVLGLDQDPDLLAPETREGLRGDLLNALKTTLQKGISAYDHVCCGTGARLDALLSIAPRIPAEFPKATEYRSVLRTSAASLGRAMLNRAFTPNPEASAGENDPAVAPPVFRLTPNAELDLAFNSGFFRGISGLGYLYLRLAEDQRALAQAATDGLAEAGSQMPDPMPGERLPSIIFGEL